MFRSLLTLCLLLTPIYLRAQTLEQKVYDAGVVVFHQHKDKSISPICSGAVIDKLESNEYIILTAAHCVAIQNKAGDTIKYKDNYYVNSSTALEGLIPADIIAVSTMSKGRDVALLKIKTDEFFAPLSIQTTPRLPFEDVLSASAPYGEEKILLRGTISLNHMDTDSWEDAFFIQMPDIEEGSSGSAVVCKSTGKICGIIVGLASSGVVAAVSTDRVYDEFKL